MPQPNLETLLRQHLTLTGKGNIIGNDNTVTVVRQTAGDYAIQIGELYLTLSHDELCRILAPVTISDSQVGVIGDHAHVEGGIHFHALPALLNHWRKQHPYTFYPVLILTILLILLFTAIVVGANFPGAQQQFQQWGLWSRAFPKERKGEILIVIATFHYSENLTNTEAHDEIRRAIETARDELDYTNLRVQVEPTRLTADDRAGAQALGDRYNASLVIWGADTGVRVTVNFFNRKQPHFEAADVQITETAHTQIANSSAYAEFITRDLPNQLTFLSLFAVGQSYYVEEAYEESAKVLEKAVTTLEELPGVVTGAAEAYFDLGWLCQGPLGDIERAIVNYTRVLELNPDHARTYNNRGVAHTAQQEYARATADFARAIELKPNDAIAYNNRGLTYVAMGTYEAALTDYTRALELNPDYAVAYNNRGLTYYSMGTYEAALTDYTRALELNPGLAEAYYNRGNTYTDMGTYEAALADYTRALELNPDYAEAYNNRGITYHDMGTYEAALADYTRALELNPDYAEAYNNRGATYYDMGTYEAALADYTRALELNPNYAAAYSNRGLTYAEMGAYEAAMADFERVLALRPDYTAAYNNRGLTYTYMGNYEAALADYTRVLELDPDDAGAYNNRGITRIYMGDYEAALADFTHATELEPNYAKAYNNRGNTYAKMGNYEAALADLTHAIELNPDFAEAYSDRGLTYAEMGAYEAALADFERALTLNPSDAEAYNNRGLTYAEMGAYEAALADFERASELIMHPGIYYNTARLYALQNQAENACAWLGKAINLDIQYREYAQTDPAFDPIRAAPCFQALMNDE